MEKAKEEYQSYVSDYFRRGAMREMADNERQTIIDGNFNQMKNVFVSIEQLFRLVFRFEKTMGRCSS